MIWSVFGHGEQGSTSAEPNWPDFFLVTDAQCCNWVDHVCPERGITHWLFS